MSARKWDRPELWTPPRVIDQGSQSDIVAPPLMDALFSPSSKQRLTEYDRDRFAGATLFDRLGRTVCRARCLARKELYESWEVARRARRRFRGGRIVDVGGGHGLLAHAMLLLDDSSPGALVVDVAVPPSSASLHDEIVVEWPRLAGRVAFVNASIEDVELDAGDLIVSSHACGAFTDRVLARAVAAGARVVVLPCCQELATCDTGGLTGWLDMALAVDVTRAARLGQQGYQVWTQQIPAEITPKNRLLLGAPKPFGETA